MGTRSRLSLRDDRGLDSQHFPKAEEPSLLAQMVKNLPAKQETQVQSLDRKIPWRRGKATHSSILAWEIPWTEEPGGLQSVGSQRVGHN